MPVALKIREFSREAIRIPEAEEIRYDRPRVVTKLAVGSASDIVRHNVRRSRFVYRDLSGAAISWQTEPPIEETFKSLAAEWTAATQHKSSLTERLLHPAYQSIIGLGREVVPLLLNELQERPDDWFWALSSVTRQNPAEGVTTFDLAVARWLGWGREQGYI